MMTTDALTIGIAYNEEVEHPDTFEIQTLGFWLRDEVSPRPSSPALLVPQHLSLPSSRTEHV